jgi:transcriptional regulator with XRE-family HTH domain
MMQTSLGHKLRLLRAERQMSLRQAAAQAGLAKETISEIERGLAHPHDVTLAKLAKAYDIPLEELLEEPEPAVPLAEAPRGAGQTEASTRTVEEFERRLAHVLEPVRAEALREQQAANRTISSEGLDRASRIVDPPEAEVARRFMEEFSPGERPLAFAEVALGHARHERRAEATADLEAKLERLEQENARLRQDIADLRSEAERESARR